MKHPQLTNWSDFEILSSRTFAVSQDILFRAFSNPQNLRNWWGPKGFTNTFHEFDFRVGGQWRFTMQGLEKGNYENHCEFTQIEEPTFIAWKRYSKPLFHVVFSFEKITDNQTKLIFRMIFETEEECNKIKPFAVDKNEENFDKLEQELKNIR